MSQVITTTQTDIAVTPSAIGRSVRWGLIALLIAIATAIYGAYGDPHPKASQENAVPFICAVVTVIALAIYGLLVPAGLKGAAAHGSRWAGCGLALGIVALLLTPVAFWSGLPVVIGTAAVLLGLAGRSSSARTLGGFAVGIGGFAVVATLAMSILGNTLAS